MISIEIKGHAHAGKSTILRVIQAALAEYGVEMLVHDHSRAMSCRDQLEPEEGPIDTEAAMKHIAETQQVGIWTHETFPVRYINPTEEMV